MGARVVVVVPETFFARHMADAQEVFPRGVGALGEGARVGLEAEVGGVAREVTGVPDEEAVERHGGDR